MSEELELYCECGMKLNRLWGGPLKCSADYCPVR